MLPWIIWGLSSLFVVLNYVQQVFPDIIAQDLGVALQADAAVLGSIAAAYLYAYALLQIPVGLIIDRFGVRRCLAPAVLVAGLGTLAFAYVHTAGDAFAVRLLMGAGSAFSFIGCLKLVQEWFPPGRFSMMAGITNTAGMLGAACGAPLAMLVKAVGWRSAMAWTGGVELVLGLLVLLVVRDRTVAPPQAATLRTLPPPPRMSDVLRDGQVWLNALYATGSSLIFAAFGGLWGSGYIRVAFGLDAVAADGTNSILFLGGIAGCLFYGWYSDYLKSRKRPLVQAGIGGLLTIAVLLYVPGIPLVVFEAGLFLAGFFSSAGIVSYALARDLYPRLSGFSIGLLNTCYYGGNATSQPLVGFLLERHAADRGMDALTVGDYRFALTSLVVFMAVALVCALLLRDPPPAAA